MKRKQTTVDLAPFALLLCVVLACAESPKPKPSAASTNEAATLVTASTLCAAYKANEVAADEYYKGKILRITGYVDTIGKDMLDTMYVTLNSREPNSFMSGQCMFAEEHKAELAQLKKGQAVTLVGLCDGKFGNVIVKDCYLEK